MSSDHAPLETLLARAGGTAAAFALVHEFEPEVFAPRLHVPVLVLHQSAGSRTASALHVELDRARVPSTWIDVTDPAGMRREELAAQILYAHVADFFAHAFAAP